MEMHALGRRGSLGLLATLAAFLLAAAAHEGREPVATGTWGGRGIALEVQKDGAKAEFDCARGEITEALMMDKQGRFEARGIYVRERMGPDREGESPERHAARYTGSVSGKTMQLTVTLTHSGEAAGSFTLTHGRTGRLHKCQ
jgi:hypothetical protein